MTKREIEYENYKRRCRERGVQPCSFREFVRSMDGYENEWEVAGHEYREERDQCPVTQK